MKEYRFKFVNKSGLHYFLTIVNTELGALEDAMKCKDEHLDHIDIYSDGKLIATFYK